MQNDFLTADEVAALGLREVGNNVQISRLALLFNTAAISIGDDARIDAFSIVSAGDPVTIGSYTHVGAGCYIFGRAGCVVGDFVSLSPRSAIFTTSDDFSGRSLIGSTIPQDFRVHLSMEPVTLENYSAVATNSTVLPGVTLHEGAVAGAHSLVNRDCEAWTIYAGSPAKPIGPRDRQCKSLGEDCMAAHRS